MLGLQSLENSIVGFTGSLTIAALLILFFFLIVLLIVGIDFRFALMFVMPLAVAFTAYGWFSLWVSIVFWLVVIGFGVFLVYRNFESF
jgi:NADH:ubiquinone oxidoreductase subunit 3 (subunit A)